MNYEEALQALRDGDLKTAIPMLAKAVEDTAYSSEALNHAYTLALYRAGERTRLANAAFEIGDAMLETRPALALDYFQRALLGGLDAACLRYIGEIFEGWAEPRPTLKSVPTKDPVKKVAHVIGSLHPDHAPVRHLKILVESLRLQGVESQVFTTEWDSSWFVNANGRDAEPSPIPGPVIASIEGDFIERADRIARAIRASCADVALYHAGINEQITARVAAFRPLPLQVNVVYGSEMDAELFDGYIHLTKQGIAAGHHATQPREWIPPASDIADRVQACAPNMRQIMGLGDDCTVSATLGDLRHVSDPAYLYVLTGLLKVFPNHFHLFAGTGDVKTIRATLHAEGVLPRVRFLGAMSDVASVMAVTDLYLCPLAISDNILLLEPMGAGRPCVAGKNLAEMLGVPELIAENELAYLKIAQSLLVDAKARRQMSDLVLARFQSQFSANSLGPKYLEFISSLQRRS